MCCYCDTVCNHIGPHSFCEAHRPNPTPVWHGIYPPAWTWTETTGPALACIAHCYCERHGSHVVCCNCGNRQLSRDLPQCPEGTE